MAGSRALPDLKARLRIDTTDAPKATQSVQQFANSLRKDLNTSAASSAKSVETMRGRLDAMIKDLERSGQGSSAAAKELQALRARIDQNATSLGLSGAATEKTTGLLGKFQAKMEAMGPVGARFSKSLEGLGITESVFAGGLIGIAAAAGVATVKLGVDLAHAASDLNEQISRTGVVFGSAQGKIVAFAEAADKNLGLSETAALSAASAFGGMFHNAGLSDEATAKMSQTLVGLSGDLASFMNLQGGSQEAADKLTMGLTGQLDVLRELGIFISDADVVNEALRLGLAKTATQVTESEKIVARYNLILQQTSQAQGDFAKTADGAANSERQLGAEVENLKTTLGTVALPAFRLWILEMSQIVEGAKDITDGIGWLNQRLRELPMGQTIKNFEDWGNALVNTISNQHKAGMSTTDYGSALAKASDMVKKATQAEKEHNDALQRAHDLVLGALGAELQYQQQLLGSHDAVASVAQAQKDLNDATRAYGPNSQQAKDAQEALQKATLDGAGAALQQAQSAEELHKKWVEEAGGVYTAEQAIQDQIVSLQQFRQTLAPGSPLIATIDGYIAKLRDEIPKMIQTHFDVYFTSSGAVTSGGEAYIPRASGGPVMPGNVYTVGEQGPETLVMGARGGYVIPNSGSVSVSNMASTRRIERLLETQNQLLAAAVAAQPMPTFSTRAYGS